MKRIFFQILVPLSFFLVCLPTFAQKADDAESFTIHLNARSIRTDSVQAKQMSQQTSFLNSIAKTKGLYLIQWNQPVLPAWKNDLEKIGLRIVDYIPENTYLVYGDPSAARALWSNFSTRPQVRWLGVMQGADKIHPDAHPTSGRSTSAVSGSRLFAIQLVFDPTSNASSLSSIKAVASGSVIRQGRSADYYNIIVPLPTAAVTGLSQLPDVISIQPYEIPEMLDERQGVILSGDLANNAPRGPGYLAWLANKGFTQEQFDASGLVVDLSDSPVDNGSTNVNHFALYRLGSLASTCRVSYSRLEGYLFPGGSTEAVDGHGTVDAHIIGGYVTFTNFPHADDSGFRYGLGVAPFVRVGSSIIFCNSTNSNFTYPVYDDLASRAYRDGARISANSWGADVSGTYTLDSQNYDRLVRDAQPPTGAVPAVGNQQMSFVFSAGNSGPGATTIGSPGSAKNIITVGAAENVRSFGGYDGSGIPDVLANNANEVIFFSSRGPCADGRIKPDLMAPGTHITGGAPLGVKSTNGLGTKLPAFVGGGVSGGVSGALFFPDGQQFYSASSGTSQACPGVVGAAALVYQWFINRGWATAVNPASPAMIKAFLMNSARYMTAVSLTDNLFSSNQGMGMVNLGMAFDDVPRLLQDQKAENLFTGSGQSRVWTNWIGTIDKPFRVTVAWTDAPGSTVGRAYKNNIDLIVENAGRLYRGNVFRGQYSIPGGSPDLRNNVESVFLPPGSVGAVKITVTAKNINSDGVPGNAFPLDQDFALVAYNCITNEPAPSPNKDFFQTALTFPGHLPASTTNNNVDTTSSPELGEPPLAGRPPQNSVWYRWQPDISGSVIFDTLGSDFDTILAVYSGSSLANLVKIAENNDISATNTNSSIRFQVVAGQPYWLTVAGGNLGPTGTYVLHGEPAPPPATPPQAPPANDSLTTGANLGSLSNVSFSGSLLWATAETGEPSLAGLSPTRSVWFRWTSPALGQLSLDTGGSDFANVLGVYTGTNFASLKLLQGKASPAIATNPITFPVQTGSIYIIKVDGARNTNGTYVLTGRLSTLAAPATLLFTNPSLSNRPASPRISWGAVSNATHYQVEILNGTNPLRAMSFQAPVTNWTNGPALPRSNGYSARVRAYSNNLGSDWTTAPAVFPP